MTGVEISRKLIYNFHCEKCGEERIGLVGSNNIKCPKCGSVMKRSEV